MCQQDAPQRAMPSDVWTPMITTDHSLRNKSMRRRNKVAHVELFARACEACAAICCDCDLWKPTTQETDNNFRSPKKKSKAKDEFFIGLKADKRESMSLSQLSRDELWDTDETYFDDIDELIFMNEIQKYPCLYDTGSKAFKKTRTVKENAWRNVAKRFRAKVEWCERRYKTIRTRVGRYLKGVRPSGSGTDDFTIDKQYDGMKWLFQFIKQRATQGNFITASGR